MLFLSAILYSLEQKIVLLFYCFLLSKFLHNYRMVRKLNWMNWMIEENNDQREFRDITTRADSIGLLRKKRISS